MILAPPPSGIVPAHQTSVYSYSVQQHPSLIHPTLNGVPGHYQAQYQAAHQTQPSTPTPSTLAASQVPTQSQNVHPEPPVAHQATPQVPQNVHEPLKSSHDNDFGARSNSKRMDPSKDRQSGFPSPIDIKTDSLTTGTYSDSNRKYASNASLSTKNSCPDVTILENDENMHRRAEDLAGKISATVTITTNATSKLSGSVAREKNDFLAGHTSTASSTSNRSVKQVQQKSNHNSSSSHHSKQLQIGGKPLLDATKIVPNLSNLKPLPQTNSNTKPSSQFSSNSTAMMATITPIYSPVPSIPVEEPKGVSAVTTKSSLRDYRKPKMKGVPSQPSHVFKTSTNALTNNRLTLPISGGKHTPNVPDEISVTTVIGPPSNKNKTAANSHHQEPAIISCYPVTKSTNQGTNKRHASSETSNVNAGKKMKPSTSQQGNSYALPKGLTITEVNVPTPYGITGGPVINPLNVCATTLDQLHGDEDDDVIPVLHIPETNNSQSESSSTKVRMQQKLSSGSKQSRLPSGISNIRPLLPGSLPKGMFGNNVPSNGHPGMPSGLLRMTATSLQQKSFQSQLNIPQFQPSLLNLQSKTSVGSSAPKVTPKDVKSRMVLNKMGIKMDDRSSGSHSSISASKSNRLTLKPPRSNVPATITMSMAESAVSAVQPTTFKPVPARPKSYSSNSKQPSTPGISAPTSSKKGSQVSSPSSSRSSSRNSSLSPRDRSGSMSSKGNPSTPTSGGTSSPKGLPKKKTTGIVYDPKAPLVSWHVRNSCGPKTCNGWNWEGEGKIQKVYLNVRSTFKPG